MLTTLGLTLNFGGAVILAVFGVPQPDHSGKSVLLYEGPEADEDKAQAGRRRTKYEWLSRSGLVLMAVGFLLQFVGEVSG